MLKSIVIDNFKSFSTPQVLEFNDKNTHLSVIYGQNAGGKSNIIKALKYIQIAVNHEDQHLDLINHHLFKPFLFNTKNKKQAVSFELRISEDNEVIYTYGFSLNPETGLLMSEYLYENNVSQVRRTDKLIFERTSTTIKFGSKHKKHLKILYEQVPINILALKKFSNANHTESATVIRQLLTDKLILFDFNELDDVREKAYQTYKDDRSLFKEALKIVQKLDMAIQNLNFEFISRQVPEKFLEKIKEIGILNPEAFKSKKMKDLRVETVHNVYDSKGNVTDYENLSAFSEESAGTNKLLVFLALMLTAMKNDYTAVIDEFGSSWHPLISIYLIKMLNSKQKNKGQFILLTHEVNLWDLDKKLNKDQIWLTQKNSKEETEIICLNQFADLRNDIKRLDKHYLDGRFGGIPIINNS